MSLTIDISNILNREVADIRNQVLKVDFSKGTSSINNRINSIIKLLTDTANVLEDIKFELTAEQKTQNLSMLSTQFKLLEKKEDGSWDLNKSGIFNTEHLNERINDVVKKVSENRKRVVLKKVNGVPIPKTKFIVGSNTNNCIVWKNATKNHSKGLFLDLTDTVSIKVPFPDIYDHLDPRSKTKTVECRNSSKTDCYIYRKNIALKNTTEIRKCSYVHTGEKYLRQGTQSRCQLARFGNHSTLSKDLFLITEQEIRKIMMHSTSDLLLVYMWIKQNNIKNKIFDQLEYYY